MRFQNSILSFQFSFYRFEFIANPGIHGKHITIGLKCRLHIAYHLLIEELYADRLAYRAA